MESSMWARDDEARTWTALDASGTTLGAPVATRRDK